MDLVNTAIACALFVTPHLTCSAQPLPTPAARNSITQWDAFVAEAARRFSIPDDWIRSVMAQESGGHTKLNGKPITSPKGAMGLMQLMPSTWQDIRSRYGLGADPYDPHDNILAGTAYLRDMADRFGAGGMFAAYNAGPERYAAYLGGAAFLPRETQTYLARLAARRAPFDMLFVVNTATTSAPLIASAQQPPVIPNSLAHDLFVLLAASPP